LITSADTGIDGLEAAKVEAAKDLCRRSPEVCPLIIAIAASALKGDKVDVSGSGMDSYIAKPTGI